MVDLIIERTDELGGAVRAPPSKAYTHRALIASSLSEGSSQIREPLICDDTLATIDACRLLGADIERGDGYINVHGALKPATPEDVIYCRDSGSTIRFITPVTALADGISILTGGESLRRRPMMPLLEALRGLGVRCYSARFDGYP
ncbi:3-phosphoshikimate 1-carboxyvinyltransferase, partial [Candidatus Bathyarchaeota archaeon]